MPPDTGTALRVDLRTTDRDVAVAAFNQVSPHRARVTLHRTDVEFRIRSAVYPEIAADLISCRGVGYCGDIEPMGYLLAGVWAEGGGRVMPTDRTATVFARGDAILYPVHTPFSVAYDQPALPQLRVPLDYTADLAEETTGLPAADLRFEAMTAVSEPARRSWAATTAYVTRQLGAPGPDLPRLLVVHLLRLSAAMILTTFPNTTMTAARIPESGQVAPAVVRRAQAFLEEHAERPVTAAEVAAAVGVGPRALQAAFRRHLDTTPMAYLRRERLERVHRALQAADPVAGVTVAEIARRWGFANPGRFARYYRAVYGQPPSHTLRV